jgi:hypothetical protein
VKTTYVIPMQAQIDSNHKPFIFMQTDSQASMLSGDSASASNQAYGWVVLIFVPVSPWRPLRLCGDLF